MSYATGEANILTVLQSMSAWNTNNSARTNWKQLNSGKSAQYCVLRPGEAYETEVISIGHRTHIITRQTVIEVWKTYKLTTDPTTLQGLVDDIITQFQKYPHLGAGSSSVYVSAIVKGGGGMEERWVVSNGPKWAYWEVVLEWQEETSVTPAE